MFKNSLLKINLSYDVTDLLFRLLFSSIFIGLGMEHLFADARIQEMMPVWLFYKRPLSMLAGVILLSGGFSLVTGMYVRRGAMLLAIFLVVVTIVVHVPALFHVPRTLPDDWRWLWDVYQRSNVVKNMCLLGGCFHLINHQVGRYTVATFITRFRKTQKDAE
ncbi:MAG: DoxX family protein [SAR324 cluster bacterium]|nr:DoxX family protein [SAR324 cluster bacterium]